MPQRLAALTGTTVLRPDFTSCVAPSILYRYRIINRFPIGYGFLPRLRGRLTRGRLPLPRKPQAFGGRGSHPSFRYLCLHSLLSFLQNRSRVFLHRLAQCSPTNHNLRYDSGISVPCLAPLHCLRTDARPVSCYALF